MKRRFFITIVLGCTLLTLSAVALTPEEKHSRDSIFGIFHSIPEDSTFVPAVHSIFRNHIGKTWVTELLDSALAFTVKEEDVRGELNLLYDYAQYYDRINNISGMEYYLKKLKVAGGKAHDYAPYFYIWRKLLQSRVAQGDTEAVLIETNQMEEEADNLAYPEGKIVARMARAQALSFAKKYEESTEIYDEILASSGVSDANKVISYGVLALNYQYMDRYDQAVCEMIKMRTLMDKIVRENPETVADYREQILGLKMRFCAIYLAISKGDSLLVHLKEAEKFYTENARNSDKVSYHTYWGGYYYLQNKWKDCFAEFDKAISYFDGSAPLYEMSILRMKAQIAMIPGFYKEAAGIYRQTVLAADSLNRDILRRHEETYQANYKIRKALLNKTRNEKWQNELILGTIFLLMFVLLCMVIRILYSHRFLRNSEREIRKALAVAEAADKMKESFLRNITYQIRLPLNAVVGLSEVLSTDKDLAPEQIQEYAVVVKQNSGRLIQLITDVLDLSRLESGMMRFNVQDCDVVQLCREAKMGVEMQEGNLVHLIFHTEMEPLYIHTDSSRFMKLLFSVLTATVECQITYTLTQEGAYARIVVEGSPLLHSQTDEIEYIRHDINRLYLETFGGTYERKESCIIITYPVSTAKFVVLGGRK